MDAKYEVLLKKTLKNVDLFTAISKNIVKDLKKLNINSNKIIEIPNGTLVSKVVNIKKIFNKQNNKILKIITVARYANKKKGFDLKLLKKSTDILKIPIIASGGVGKLEHFEDGVLKGGASALLAASVFHFNEFSIKEVKKFLKQKNIPVRL